jgi:hypothetical protein
MKYNLEYYRHEADSHNHWKFKALRRKYGWAGEGKFWALNNIIADSNYCSLDLSDESKLFETAADLDFEVDEFKDFLFYLFEKCKLIRMEGMKITTKITQENLAEVEHKRERQREWKKNKGASKAEESTAKDEKSTSTNEEIDGENEQSKVKESKEKESNNKDSYESPETIVSVPMADRELKIEYKAIADDQKKIADFIRAKKPKFIEPYARLWNFLSAERGFTQIKTLTDSRKQKIKTRSGEEAFDFVTIIEKARKSSFLVEGKSWFTFDWILANQSNYVKVLEGNYDNEQRQKTQTQKDEYLQQRQKAKERLASRL